MSVGKQDKETKGQRVEKGISSFATDRCICERMRGVLAVHNVDMTQRQEPPTEHLKRYSMQGSGGRWLHACAGKSPARWGPLEAPK